MKLIDILVQELPKLGGWPIGADSIYQNAKGHLVGVQGCIVSPVDMELGVVAEDTHRSVTREQYEAALAASKPEWDGKGLPPVGSKVSFFYNERYDYNEEIIPQDGQELEVVAHKTTTDEHDVAVCYWDENGGGMSVCLVPGSLRPILSEADKKRYEAILQLSHSLRANGSVTEEQLCRLYSDIAAGYIPHIRID